MLFGMSSNILHLDDAWLPEQLGRVVAEARNLIRWSQAELAERADTSQPTISRLESGAGTVLDLRVVGRVLKALGIRSTLSLDAPHLRDRARQHDPVHARLVAYVAKRLEREGWDVATEVQIGDPDPKGWIDLLAFRRVDRAGLVGEVKADLPDLGALQRQVAFYGRAAAWAARPLGWRLERSAVLVACLHSRALAGRLGDNRDLIHRGFPTAAAEMEAWIRSPAARCPAAPGLAMVDPLSRRARWLRAAPLDARRSSPAYRDYADAAARISGPRPRAGPPRSRPSSSRSRAP